MTVYLLLAVEDKCQVSRTNVKFPKKTTKMGKNEIFPQMDKLGPIGEKGRCHRPWIHIKEELEQRTRDLRPRELLLA